MTVHILHILLNMSILYMAAYRNSYTCYYCHTHKSLACPVLNSSAVIPSVTYRYPLQHKVCSLPLGLYLYVHIRSKASTSVYPRPFSCEFWKNR